MLVMAAPPKHALPMTRRLDPSVTLASLGQLKKHSQPAHSPSSVTLLLMRTLRSWLQLEQT